MRPSPLVTPAQIGLRVLVSAAVLWYLVESGSAGWIRKGLDSALLSPDLPGKLALWYLSALALTVGWALTRLGPPGTGRFPRRGLRAAGIAGCVVATWVLAACMGDATTKLDHVRPYVYPHDLVKAAAGLRMLGLGGIVCLAALVAAGILRWIEARTADTV